MSDGMVPFRRSMILAEGYWHGEKYIPEIVDDPWANTHRVDCRYGSSKNTSGD